MMDKVFKTLCSVCSKEIYQSDDPMKEVLISGAPILEIVWNIFKSIDCIEVKTNPKKVCSRCLMMLTEAHFNKAKMHGTKFQIKTESIDTSGISNMIVDDDDEFHLQLKNEPVDKYDTNMDSEKLDNRMSFENDIGSEVTSTKKSTPIPETAPISPVIPFLDLETIFKILKVNNQTFKKRKSDHDSDFEIEKKRRKRSTKEDKRNEKLKSIETLRGEYSCNLCPKRYKYPKRLQIHMMCIHTNL